MRFVDPEHFLTDPGAGDIAEHMAATGLNGTGQVPA